MKARFLIVVFACLLVVSAGHDAAAQVPAEGSAAPTFTLPSQDGNAVSLSSLKGKWVVLYFYPRDFTSGCTLQAHNFQRDLAKYEEKNAVIVGVSVDAVDSHKSFCTKEGLTFKVLADTDHSVTTKYGSIAKHENVTYAARNTFLIDPSGVIRKVYLKVKPAANSDEVLADLAALQAMK